MWWFIQLALINCTKEHNLVLFEDLEFSFVNFWKVNFVTIIQFTPGNCRKQKYFCFKLYNLHIKLNESV